MNGSMGDYGLYVWAAYACAAIVLLVNVIAVLLRARTVRRMLSEVYRIEGSAK